MASPKFNSKSPTIKRILREAKDLTQSPDPNLHASPASDTDLFEWHFTLRGPPSSPFATGIYHGRITLPPTYPMRPPSFRFLTPSGRFECNREICLSISNHHEESWQPAWGIRTALTALRAFMETDAKGQLGGLDVPSKEREKIASGTGSWKCSVCARTNGDILKESEEAAAGKAKEGGKVEEVEVPSELQMGWKDEMGRKKGESEERDNGAETSAELAEGFVRTGDGAADAPVVEAQASVSAPAPELTPEQRAVQAREQLETAMNRVSQQAQQPLQQLVQRPAQVQVRSNDGVPMWIDRAIAGVVILLAAMFMKIILGL